MTLKDLEKHKFQKGKVQLNNHTKTLDCEKFVKSHIAVLKANPGNALYLPYWDRLVELKKKSK